MLNWQIWTRFRVFTLLFCHQLVTLCLAHQCRWLIMYIFWFYLPSSLHFLSAFLSHSSSFSFYVYTLDYYSSSLSPVLSYFILSPIFIPLSKLFLIFFLIFYQLAVGPVAIVSLLTGTLIAKWRPDYAINKEGAMDTAAQASLCTGIVST